MNGLDKIKSEVRESASIEIRLGQSIIRISKMCSEGRSPKMSIPVRPDDDDIFITTTLEDAISMSNKLDEMSQALATADLVHKVIEGILGQKCLPSQMPRFLADRINALVAAAQHTVLTGEGLNELDAALSGNWSAR